MYLWYDIRVNEIGAEGEHRNQLFCCFFWDFWYLFDNDDADDDDDDDDDGDDDDDDDDDDYDDNEEACRHLPVHIRLPSLYTCKMSCRRQEFISQQFFGGVDRFLSKVYISRFWV